MTAITALATPFSSTAPAGLAPPGGTIAIDFAALLAGGETIPAIMPRGQGGAGDGKDLPGLPPGADEDTHDDGDPSIDPALLGLALPTPVPTATQLSAPSAPCAPGVAEVKLADVAGAGGGVVVSPVTTGGPAPLASDQAPANPASPAILTLDRPPPAADAPGIVVAAAGDAAPVTITDVDRSPSADMRTTATTPGPSALFDRIAAAIAGPAAAPAQERADTPAAAAPVQTTQAQLAAPVAGPRVAPAAQMFAGAIQRALHDDGRPSGDALATAGAPIAIAAMNAVAATHQTQGGALDMQQHDWPEKMIERIAILRDAADAADTRIRIVPDALGTIDVSLKRDGDAVQVQFAASQPETRQLLADARPQLDALAGERGLRLSHGGAGNAGDSGGQQQRPAPQAAAAPQPAARSAADADDQSTDTRVA